MIEFVEGRLTAYSPTHAVVEVGGVGLLLNIPLSSFDTSRRTGDSVRMFTHLHVREDILALYGFATEAERTVFRHLIGVSGIGPQMAQTILSGISLDDFVGLISAGDAKGLTRIKGIGQKTAQRLVLELKDRLVELGVSGGSPVPEPTGDGGTIGEAVAALVGLGANPAKARQVVEKVAESGDLSVEDIIKEALRKI